MKLVLNVFLKLNLKNNLYLFYFVLFFIFNSSAQNHTQISNIFRGHFYGLGWNQGWDEEESHGSIIFDCSTCTEISNAYLIAIEINATHNTLLNPIEKVFFINNTPITLNNSTRIGLKKIINPTNDEAYLHFIKFPFECLQNGEIKFDIPNQEYYHQITGFYILFECLNNLDNEINYQIILNNGTINPDFEVLLQNSVEVNSIDLNMDVGLSIVGHTFNYLNGDASIVSVYGNQIGLIAGQDSSSKQNWSSGVRGHFEYSNGTLIGLDDDTPDNIMHGTDALANIQNLISNNSSIYLSCNHEFLGNRTNYTQAAILAYKTNCSSFPYSSPSDTTTCANSPLQLLATGGTSTGSLPAYEWQPATGLSCTDCPNPVFTSDSSMFYTVRIRSNDSCSVVRPLKINVRPQPVFSEILTTKSECFGTTGSITATSQAQGASYSLDGGAVQSSGFFENLAAGDYLLTLHDVNGCTIDTLITIEDTLTVSAQFAVTPSSGAAPLTVQITNQSQHATDYEWFLNGASQGNSFPSYTFDTSGVYEIMLYAWQNNPSCIDSFSISIQVYDSLMVEIPNVFTPNNDGINEAFGITVNIPAEVKYRIFNRWGNEMEAGSVWTTPGVFVPIWSGNNASEGVYFYQLEVRDLSMSSPSVPLPKGEDEIYVIFNGFFELRK